MTLDTMREAVAILTTQGHRATLEYPGCICVEQDGKYFLFGDVNPQFGCDMYISLQSFETGDPAPVPIDTPLTSDHDSSTDVAMAIENVLDSQIQEKPLPEAEFRALMERVRTGELSNVEVPPPAVIPARMTPVEQELVIRIARAKLEILKDMRRGIVPRDVASFSQLHDYVDANGYGGAFEEDAHSVEDMDFWNELQRQVDLWLKVRVRGEKAPE